MRRNFYELLSQRAIDVEKEYSTLWKLFCVEKCTSSSYSTYSLRRWIDEKYFRSLPFRGSFASLTDMMDEFGLHERTKATLEKLFLFCELICAMFYDFKKLTDTRTVQQANTIMQNIIYILDRTNHEFVKDPNGNSIIVEKSKTATLAAQLVDDEVIAFDLIEYNHFALKGDLERKKKLLFSIAAHIEPILKSHTLQKNGYKQIESDAGFLFNNFHIRHNNKVGAKVQDYITAVKDTELEEWYDKAYEVALTVIIVNNYLTIGQDVSDIKSKYTWRS